VHRAAFHTGDALGDADHHPWLEHLAASDDFANEVAQHGLGHNIVRDHTVSHGPGDLDALWRTADHIARLLPDGDDLVIPDRDGHDGWLAQHDAPSAHIYQDIDRAQVNADESFEHDGS